MKYVTEDNLTKYDKLLKQNVAILARNTAYTDGTIVQKGQYYLKCVKSGTTAAGALTGLSGTYGTILTDGTAEWQIVDYYQETKVFNWQSNIVYEVGRIVLYDGLFYRCKSKHTSGSSFAVNFWEKIGIDENIVPKVLNWAANTVYKANQLVVYNETLYRVNNDHTSGSSFDATGYDIVYSSIKEWVTGIDYKVGSTVIYDNKLYRCKTRHKSDTSLYNDIRCWELIGVTIDTWVSGNSYFVGDVIEKGSALYKCIQANNDTNFTPGKWQRFSALALIPEWTPSTDYTTESVVIYDKVMYRCTAEHTSSSTFAPDIRLGRWELVYSSIPEWYSTGIYKAGATVSNTFKQYRSINNSYASAFTKYYWRPYIPVIEDWMGYTDATDMDGLVVNMRFNTRSEAYLDDFGHTANIGITSSHLYPYEYDVCAHPTYPLLSGYGGYCGVAGSSDDHFGGAVASIDMRELYESTITGEDILQQIYNDGGITVEVYQYWLANIMGGFINVINIIHLLKSLPANQSPSKTLFSFPERLSVLFSGDNAGWHHVSFNWKIDSLSLNSSPKRVDWTLTIYVDGVLKYTKTTYAEASNPSSCVYFVYNLTPKGAMTNLQVWRGLKRTGDFTVPTKEVNFNGTRFFAYEEGEYVIKDSKLYRCIVRNTDTVWDPSHWEAISVETVSLTIDDWQPNTDYSVNSVVIYGGNLYRANTAHTSDSSSFAADSSKWDMISDSGSTTQTWAANTPYSTGDIILHNGDLYVANIDFTSGTTFNDNNLTWYGGTEMTSTEINDLIDLF